MQVKGEDSADSYIDYKPLLPLMDSQKKSYTPEDNDLPKQKSYSESLGYYAPLHSKIDVISMSYEN